MSETGNLKRVPKQTDKARAALEEQLTSKKRKQLEKSLTDSDGSDNEASNTAKKQRRVVSNAARVVPTRTQNRQEASEARATPTTTAGGESGDEVITIDTDNEAETTLEGSGDELSELSIVANQ